MDSTALKYYLGEEVEAFSTRRNCVLPYDVICAHQVHDNNVACVETPGLTREDLEGFDALITSNPECAIAVRTADCIPILMFDPVKRVVAAVHSGWKGTVKRIPKKCIFQMIQHYGCNPHDIRAIIGPGISIDSFQVGEEVVNTFKAADFNISEIYRWDGPKSDLPMKGGHHLDLFKANRIILEEAGLKSENIQSCGIDTYTDESFFSARREGTGCGRIINVIRLKKYLTLIYSMATAAILFCACKSEVPQPVKIADYIFEVTLDEYSAQAPNELLDAATTDFGCTAVRSGNRSRRECRTSLCANFPNTPCMPMA